MVRSKSACTMCTPPALKHYTLIQTLHRYPFPFSSFYSFLLTARGALTVSRGGSCARGLIRLVHPGVGPWRYQVAKCAFSAGPDLGSFLSHHSSCLCHRCT